MKVKHMIGTYFIRWWNTNDWVTIFWFILRSLCVWPLLKLSCLPFYAIISIKMS